MFQVHPLLCKDFKAVGSDRNDRVPIRILDGILCYLSPDLVIADFDLHSVGTGANRHLWLLDLVLGILTCSIMMAETGCLGAWTPARLVSNLVSCNEKRV